MQKSKLETIYLAKIVLHIQTSEYLKLFLQINKKCLDAIKCLKVNPHFINSNSIKWFFKHFHPDTIDCSNVPHQLKDILFQCNRIRNINFLPLYEENLMTPENIITIFSKITVMRLATYETIE